MNTEQVNNYPWSQDLEVSRDLIRSEKSGFAIILGWYETWRLSQSLPACRETAAAFWKLKVKAKDRASERTFFHLSALFKSAELTLGRVRVPSLEFQGSWVRGCIPLLRFPVSG